MAEITHLIVGLGNPGPEYQNTRHNIGFMAVDAIAEHFGAVSWKKKFKGHASTLARIPEVLLLKPMTFMNLSGESVGDALRFHKLTPEKVIVFHDDLDLAPAQVKIKQGGGSGGHNGLKSIDAHIGQNYWRIRLGIGHPGVRGDAVTHHVLGHFSKSDQVWLQPLLEELASDFNLILEGKTASYLGQINRKIQANFVG